MSDLAARGKKADPFTPTFTTLDSRRDLVTPLMSWPSARSRMAAPGWPTP